MVRATVDGHKARDKKQVEDCDTIRKVKLAQVTQHWRRAAGQKFEGKNGSR
jgi:hypothetical protein